MSSELRRWPPWLHEHLVKICVELLAKPKIIPGKSAREGAGSPEAHGGGRAEGAPQPPEEGGRLPRARALANGRRQGGCAQGARGPAAAGWQAARAFGGSRGTASECRRPLPPPQTDLFISVLIPLKKSPVSRP